MFCLCSLNAQRPDRAGGQGSCSRCQQSLGWGWKQAGGHPPQAWPPLAGGRKRSRGPGPVPHPPGHTCPEAPGRAEAAAGPPLGLGLPGPSAPGGPGSQQAGDTTSAHLPARTSGCQAVDPWPNDALFPPSPSARELGDTQTQGPHRPVPLGGGTEHLPPVFRGATRRGRHPATHPEREHEAPTGPGREPGARTPPPPLQASARTRVHTHAAAVTSPRPRNHSSRPGVGLRARTPTRAAPGADPLPQAEPALPPRQNCPLHTRRPRPALSSPLSSRGGSCWPAGGDGESAYAETPVSSGRGQVPGPPGWWGCGEDTLSLLLTLGPRCGLPPTSEKLQGGLRTRPGTPGLNGLLGYGGRAPQGLLPSAKPVTVPARERASGRDWPPEADWKGCCQPQAVGSACALNEKTGCRGPSPAGPGPRGKERARRPTWGSYAGPASHCQRGQSWPSLRARPSPKPS